MAANKQRVIRSFVRREGRITLKQTRALSEYWSRYGIDLLEDECLDVNEAFNGEKAPLVLEIGFGMGVSLVSMAESMQDNNFLGIEVFRPGLGNICNLLVERDVNNVRLLYGDAVEILKKHIVESSLDRVQLFFPDPWPKTRHRKRRIVQPSFAELVCSRLKLGGVFHMATDWQEYAKHMLSVVDATVGLENQAGRGKYADRPGYRPETKFEKRGRGLGHGVWDLLYVKSG